MTGTLENRYSSQGTQRELLNEYQHDRVPMVFKNLCIHLLWTKIALALEGLTLSELGISWSQAPRALLNSPAAPSNLSREPNDVLVSIHNTFK